MSALRIAEILVKMIPLPCPNPFPPPPFECHTLTLFNPFTSIGESNRWFVGVIVEIHRFESLWKVLHVRLDRLLGSVFSQPQLDVQFRLNHPARLTKQLLPRFLSWQKPNTLVIVRITINIQMAVHTSVTYVQNVQICKCLYTHNICQKRPHLSVFIHP